MSKNYLFILVLAAMMVGFGLGFLYSSSRARTDQPSTLPISTAQTQVTNPLFKMQTALVEGKVVEIGENSLVLEGSGNGKEQFPVSEKFVVYVPVKNTRTATASSQLQLVEKNRESLIILELIDGKYQVVSVSYIPR